MEIVAFRGDLQKKHKDGSKYSLEDFIKRLQEKSPPEIDTQDNVKNLSIALFNAPKIDYRNKDLRDGIEGIGKGSIVVVKKETLTKKGATISPAPQTGFANHALMSSIQAKDVFTIFKSSGVHFYYDPDED